MTIIPCGHRILVKPEKLHDADPTYRQAAAAGILIPEMAKKLEQAAMDKGVVVAIGPTAFKDFGGEAWCKVGDTIAFAKYGGKYIGDDLILNDEDVIAVLKETND